MTTFTSRSIAHPGKKWRRVALIAAGAVVILIAVFAVFLAIRWPFTRARVLASIRDSWPGMVRDGNFGFQTKIFPHPGCNIENLVLELPSQRSKEPVRAVFKKVEIRALYLDLLLRPGRVSTLTVEGLRVEIPVYSAHASASAPTENKNPETRDSQTGSKASKQKSATTTFGKVALQGAVLVVDRSGQKGPLTFAVHRLLMWPVRPNTPISFEAALTNAEPPGEVQIKGKLGPVTSRQWADLRISGSYQFEKADLGVFSSIGGILSSSGTVDGPLKQLKVQGALEVPAFQVKRSPHEVNLSAKFDAVEDATRGDTTLQNVDASFLRTRVHAQGAIASMAGRPGKTTDVNLTVRNGRVQDVLDLFVTEKMPPMDGTTDFRAHVIIPSGDAPFMKKLDSDGQFSISGAVLTNESRQGQLNDLSKRASGNAKDPQADPVAGSVEAKFRMRTGVVQFNPLIFQIPGASVSMAGRYNVLNDRIDFHGSAKTAASVSQQSKGIKSALLKPFDWIFKKKDAGAEVPVEMTGTYDNPHFGLDLTGKK